MKPLRITASKYDPVTDNEPFIVETDQPLYLACCDCHLVHLVSLEKVRGGIKVTMSRAERNTASMRRYNKKKPKCKT